MKPIGGINVKNINNTRLLFQKYITPAMQGFKLAVRGNSFVYTRTGSESVQQVEFVTQTSINNGELVFLRIYPRVNVYFEKINEFARAIFKRCLTEAGIEHSINNSTYCIPVDTDNKTDSENRDSVDITFNNCSKEAEIIQNVLCEKVLPLLDRLKTSDGFISCWENNNIMYPHRFAIYIICAYILKNNKEKAVVTAEDFFKKTDNISEYNALMNYIKTNDI